MYKSLNKEALQELIELGLWRDIIDDDEDMLSAEDFGNWLAIHSDDLPRHTSHKRVVDDDFRWVFDGSDIRVRDTNDIERTIDRDLRGTDRRSRRRRYR